MMLNKILFLFLLGFFVFYSLGQAANPHPKLVILYTGDTNGQVEPCG
jgi:hypothetical protein